MEEEITLVMNYETVNILLETGIIVFSIASLYKSWLIKGKLETELNDIRHKLNEEKTMREDLQTFLKISYHKKWQHYYIKEV